MRRSHYVHNPDFVVHSTGCRDITDYKRMGVAELIRGAHRGRVHPRCKHGLQGAHTVYVQQLRSSGSKPLIADDMFNVRRFGLLARTLFAFPWMPLGLILWGVPFGGLVLVVSGSSPAVHRWVRHADALDGSLAYFGSYLAFAGLAMLLLTPKLLRDRKSWPVYVVWALAAPGVVLCALLVGMWAVVGAVFAAIAAVGGGVFTLGNFGGKSWGNQFGGGSNGSAGFLLAGGWVLGWTVFYLMVTTLFTSAIVLVGIALVVGAITGDSNFYAQHLNHAHLWVTLILVIVTVGTPALITRLNGITSVRALLRVVTTGVIVKNEPAAPRVSRAPAPGAERPEHLALPGMYKRSAPTTPVATSSVPANAEGAPGHAAAGAWDASGLADEKLIGRMHPYRKTASWAVWGTVHPRPQFTRASALDVPTDDPALNAVLRSDVVMLGLNRGNAAHSDAADWGNFHTAGVHNDHLIAEAFRATPYWGAYMTDLYSVIESDSTQVDHHAPDVTDLVRELTLLNGRAPVTVIAFGRKVHDAISRHQRELGGLVATSVCVPHYSGSNAGQHRNHPATYRYLVHTAIGAAGLPATTAPGTDS